MSSVYVVMYDDISNSLIYDCIVCLITFLGASVLRLRSQDGMVWYQYGMVWYHTVYSTCTIISYGNSIKLHRIPYHTVPTILIL